MDEELKLHLEAMEARLMGRITGLQEQMLDRFRATGETLKTINTSLELMTSLLSDFARRITDLEKKP